MVRTALQKFILLCMEIALIDFVQQTHADVIMNCTKFTYCIDSYADIYKSLTTEKNSFNIESALYPAMMPSSLVVKVQIYGPNDTFAANYTWSVNCLYVAFPLEVLQVLSLGSILVTPRTQELKICIPDFCQNFSSVKEQRDLMRDVLAALQDLAVNPGIRDPRMNTAECVIQGHKPNITATGRSLYIQIKAMLWCSFIFVLPAGPYLALVVWDVLKKFRSDDSSVSLFCCRNRQNPLASSIICFCLILFFVESGILLYVLVCSVSGNAPFDIYIILGLLIFEILVSIFCFKSPDCCTCDSLINALIKIIANLTVYHFCWLLIGIMINPTWGLAVLLIVSFLCVALAYALYKIFETGECCDIKQLVIWVISFFGVCSLVVSAVLAGRSFYGRESADDVMKTVLLYVIGALISWISYGQSSPQGNGERTNQEKARELDALQDTEET